MSDVLPRNARAVMASRVEPAVSLDFFPTPTWAGRALAEYGDVDLSGTIWEPACGEGHLVRALSGIPGSVCFGSDIHDYGQGYAVHDFLTERLPEGLERPHWIITNPPFCNDLPLTFFEIAIHIAAIGVAFFSRIAALDGVDRYYAIYRPYRGHFSWVQFVERVAIAKGRVNPRGGTASTYGWLVVTPGRPRPDSLIHIPPCRLALQRPGDERPFFNPIREAG